MPSKPSCCTTPSCPDFRAQQTAVATCLARARSVSVLLEQTLGAGRDPGIEPPFGLNDGRLLAVPGQNPGLTVERQDVRADRAYLTREVLKIALMRNRALAGDDVAGEEHAEFLAVQAHRSRAVAWRVYHLEGHVSDLEDPAVLHVDVGLVALMRVPPGQPVGGVQRDRRLVPAGDIERRADMPGMTVRADHGEHLALCDDRHDGVGRLAGIDDDHLVIITDDPGVDRACHPVDSRPHLVLPSRTERLPAAVTQLRSGSWPGPR